MTCFTSRMGLGVGVYGFCFGERGLKIKLCFSVLKCGSPLVWFKDCIQGRLPRKSKGPNNEVLGFRIALWFCRFMFGRVYDY